MNAIELRMTQILEEWEASLKTGNWNYDIQNELCLELMADPHSEAGFVKENPAYGVYYNISIQEGDDSAEFHEEVYKVRFKIFELLEKMLWTVCPNNTNNDPCAFEYKMDPDHLGDHVDFQVKVIDYFS